VKPTYDELIAALQVIGPFEIVQGDTIHRTNPGSRQQLNTCKNWVVGSDDRSASRLLKAVETINAAL
jgi:hypothetical protein